MKDNDTKLLEEAYQEVIEEETCKEIYSLLERKITSVLGKDKDMDYYFKTKDQFAGEKLVDDIESLAQALADTPLGKMIFNVMRHSKDPDGKLDVRKFLVNLKFQEAPSDERSGLGQFAGSFQ